MVQVLTAVAARIYSDTLNIMHLFRPFKHNAFIHIQFAFYYLAYIKFRVDRL